VSFKINSAVDMVNCKAGFSTDNITGIDLIQTNTNNGSSVSLRAYLEGFIVSEADRRQAEKIISESNTAEKLRYCFKNNSVLRKAKSDYENLYHTRRLDGNSLADYINQLPSTTKVFRYTDELTRRFNALENFVLMPIELENKKELAEEHLTVRLKSIEMLEEVLELIAVKSRAFS